MGRDSLGQMTSLGILTGYGVRNNLGISPGYGTLDGLEMSALYSSLVFDPESFTTAGSSTLTLTAKDAENAALEGLVGTLTLDVGTVSAASSTVATSDSSVLNDGVEYATISVTVLDTDGLPVVGLPSASLTPASTGTNNTFTAVDTVTDGFGKFRWRLSSTSAEAKTVSVTVLGTAITDTAAVTFTGVPVTPWFEEPWNYTDTANMQSDPNNWFEADTDTHPSYTDIALSTGLTTPWGGTKAMQLQWADATAIYGTEVTIGKTITVPDAAVDQIREIWVELYVNFSSGFDVTGGGYSQDYKTWFLLHQINGDGSQARYRWSTGNSAAPRRIAWFPNAAEGSSVTEQAWTEGATGATEDRIYIDSLLDGAWHQVRFYAKMSTDEVTADAASKVWFDGTLVIDRSGYTTTSPGYAVANQYFRGMSLGRNIYAPTAAQTLDWGRIRAYDTNPGWT